MVTILFEATQGHRFSPTIEISELILNQNICFVHPIFGFWFLVTYGDEVTKIDKYQSRNFIRNVSRDQRIDKSATSIQSLLNTNGATFLMTSHVRSALWTLPDR